MATDTPDIAAAERRRRFLQREIENGQNFSDELAREYASFAKEDQKKIRESKIFASFVRVSGLPIDPLNHENKCPPFPDIRIVINDRPQYFELAEVADQALAESTSKAAKTGSAEWVWFEHDHTIIIRRLREKCAKSYRSDGYPVDLIVYFDWHHPPPLPCTFDERDQAEIRRLILESTFSAVWIYDNRSVRILWKLEREQL